MTKHRTMARQPAAIHAKLRRAPTSKPIKVIHRPLGIPRKPQPRKPD